MANNGYLGNSSLKRTEVEHSYTEEEVLEYIGYVDLIHARYHYKVPLSPKEWFKQIKSKQDE